MKLSLKDHRTDTLLSQRLALIGVSGVLLMANLLLVICLVTREERWILIPQYDISRQMALSTDSFSENYLSEWAMSLCEDLLTVNPQTVDVKRERFLQIAARPTGEVQDSLSKMVESIQKNKASTVFYPKRTQVDSTRHRVGVGGTFLTYLGRDHRPVSQDRWFWVSWQRGPHGVLLVKDMKEGKES